MSYEEEKFMNYISRVVLASLSLLKICGCEKKSCIAEQVPEIVSKIEFITRIMTSNKNILILNQLHDYILNNKVEYVYSCRKD